MASNKQLESVAEYQGLRVMVVNVSKNAYRGLAGAEGTVEVANNGSLGVRLDNYTNVASSKGIFWFKKHEVKIIEAEYLLEEEIQKSMKEQQGYSFVAKVKLLEDQSASEYWFALYTSDYMNLKRTAGKVNPGQLVVVNPRNYKTRVLGELVDVICVEDPEHPGTLNPAAKDIRPTAEVIGVVVMERFAATLRDIERQKEIATIRQELDRELDKLAKERRDSSHYAHVISTMYPGNETLMALLDRLKDLEEKKSCQMSL